MAVVVVAPFVQAITDHVGYKQSGQAVLSSSHCARPEPIPMASLPCLSPSLSHIQKGNSLPGPLRRQSPSPLHRRPPLLLFLRDGSSFSQTPPWLGSEVATPYGFSQTTASLPPIKLLPPHPSDAPPVVISWLSHRDCTHLPSSPCKPWRGLYMNLGPDSFQKPSS